MALPLLTLDISSLSEIEPGTLIRFASILTHANSLRTIDHGMRLENAAWRLWAKHDPSSTHNTPPYCPVVALDYFFRTLVSQPMPKRHPASRAKHPRPSSSKLATPQPHHGSSATSPSTNTSAPQRPSMAKPPRQKMFFISTSNTDSDPKDGDEDYDDNNSFPGLTHQKLSSQSSILDNSSPISAATTSKANVNLGASGIVKSTTLPPELPSSSTKPPDAPQVPVPTEPTDTADNDSSGDWQDDSSSDWASDYSTSMSSQVANNPQRNVPSGVLNSHSGPLASPKMLTVPEGSSRQSLLSQIFRSDAPGPSGLNQRNRSAVQLGTTRLPGHPLHSSKSAVALPTHHQYQRRARPENVELEPTSDEEEASSDYNTDSSTNSKGAKENQTVDTAAKSTRRRKSKGNNSEELTESQAHALASAIARRQGLAERKAQQEQQEQQQHQQQKQQKQQDSAREDNRDNRDKTIRSNLSSTELSETLRRNLVENKSKDTGSAEVYPRRPFPMRAATAIGAMTGITLGAKKKSEPPVESRQQHTEQHTPTPISSSTSETSDYSDDDEEEERGHEDYHEVNGYGTLRHGHSRMSGYAVNLPRRHTSEHLDQLTYRRAPVKRNTSAVALSKMVSAFGDPNPYPVARQHPGDTSQLTPTQLQARQQMRQEREQRRSRSRLNLMTMSSLGRTESSSGSSTTKGELKGENSNNKNKSSATVQQSDFYTSGFHQTGW